MMHLDDLVRVLGARPHGPLPRAKWCGVSTDSRSLKAGEIFFALQGPNHDGHAHVRSAHAKGALAAVVERPVECEIPQIVVTDALRALGDLAAAVRLMLRARVVAITGSSGKTTTKEMVAHLLGQRARVHRAAASFNNFVGVPLTILSADPAADYLVLELGTNAPGEISRLANIARPDVAVITGVGPVHLERLGTVEGVACEKSSILRHLRTGGHAVVNGDQAALLDRVHLPPEKVLTFGVGPKSIFRAERIEAGSDGVRFTLWGEPFELRLLGGWNASNAMAAVAVGMLEGVPIGRCARALKDLPPPKMRMERLRLGGVTILNDSYNSNPVSAAAAVAEFDRIATGRKIAVIGDMKELGSSSASHHADLGRALSATTIDQVVAVGPECAHLVAACARPVSHFASIEGTREFLQETVRPGDCVLLKGSRAMSLEKAVKYIAERLTQSRSRVAV